MTDERSRNMQGFAMIPRTVLHDATIPTDAKMIYLILSSYVGKHDGVWPSHKTIADDAGLSPSTVKRQLRVLRDRGLVRWTNHLAPGTDCKTINTYELIAATPTPQQIPIGQPDPTSTETLGSVRAIEDSGQVTQTVGSERPTNDKNLRTKPKNKDQKTASQSSAKARRVDDLFEAMVDVCGINRSELTDAQRGSLNGALRQLRAVNATPDEIHARAARYRAQMPQARLTPPALAKHWPTLGVQTLALAVGGSRGGARIPLGNGRYIGSDGVERAMPPSGRFAAE